ncbi:hypothetical protein BDW72DRAFT_206176 [Aspergillus terricola var. indicus]
MKAWSRIRVVPLTCNSIVATTSRRHTPAQRINQVLTLQDGRTLGYAEYGNPKGFPLLYFHGFPSSRLEGSAFDDIAWRQNLRIIKGAYLDRKEVDIARGHLFPVSTSSDFGRLCSSLPLGAEESTLPTEERRRLAMKMVFEAFEQGGAATVQEAVLLSHDWGFRFEDITYSKIQLWHGQKDAQSPIQLIRYMAERLPHCVLHEFEGETHFTVAGYIEEILTAFSHLALRHILQESTTYTS